LGPEKVLLIRELGVGLEAILVVDNTAAGPSIGGIRLAPDISVGEVARLARSMTLKNAAAGLRHGGGKAGIVGDPAMPSGERDRLVRAFGQAIRDVDDYIPGPDMGIDETCMASIYDEIGRAVGLPAALGGIPLDTLGATAFGLAVAADVAQGRGVVELDGARVVIQGFGAVGTHAARFLVDRGASVIAVSDSAGGIVQPDGFDVEKLIRWKSEGNSVAEFPNGAALTFHEMVRLDCEIWIPAARPDVFTRHNAGEVRASLILPGANIAVTEEADGIFLGRGITHLPDFIVNAGGVICGAAEYAGATAAQAFTLIDEKIRTNTDDVMDRAASMGVSPARTAKAMAHERVREMMAYRRAY
jgi:glutamate dehydrogenase/leucine dehydrogenase